MLVPEFGYCLKDTLYIGFFPHTAASSISGTLILFWREISLKGFSVIKSRDLSSIASLVGIVGSILRLSPTPHMHTLYNRKQYYFSHRIHTHIYTK